MDNKVYNFISSPTDFFIEKLPAIEIKSPIPDSSSNIFFTKRDFNKSKEENSSIIQIIFIFLIPICSYFLFHFLILRKLFHGSKKLKILLGLFIPIAIYTSFFTNLNCYIVLLLYGLGMSCFKPGKIKEELENQLS